MNGELTLVAPVARRAGRRMLGVGIAATAHAMIVLLLLLLTRQGSTTAAPVETPAPAEMPMPEPVDMSAIMPMTVSAPPTAYESPAVEKSPAEPSAPVPGADQGAGSWRDFLPHALSLQAEGVRAPTYVIDNLDATVIADVTTRGLAFLIAGRPPFRDDTSRVVWTKAGPTSLEPLPPAWANDAARRGLPLPRHWYANLTLAPNSALYMIPSAALDAGILAAQIRAADSRGVPLSGVARTRGRLVAEADGALAYVIDTVELANRATTAPNH